MFKTKTKTFISRPRPRPFCDVYRPTEKYLIISVVNKNEIPFTDENETKTKTDIHFRPKNENESHLIIVVFFFLFHIQSPSQPYNAPQYLIQFRLFCRWSLLTGFHFPHVQCRGVDLGGCGGHDPLKICRRGQSMFWPPENVTLYNFKFHNIKDE